MTADHFTEALSAFDQLSREDSHETIQFVVWIVGLSTALLAFLGANEQSVLAGAGFRHELSVSLFATIVAGVLQRLCQQMRRSKEQQTLNELRVKTALFRYEQSEPLPLLPEWPKAHIVANMQHFFDLDYSYLLSSDFSLDQARDRYSFLYNSFEEMSEHKMKEFQRMFIAVNGQQSVEDTAVVRESDERGLIDYSALERYSTSAIMWRMTSTFLFRATAFFFLIAMFIFLQGLLTSTA